ncbi:MAG TPA: type IVB secretion system protein IcmJDotN [Coxiellaceae bacterium]|nr:type IVB secretion system protein IcmJDotN [Coxiellaceae bacterium]
MSYTEFATELKLTASADNWRLFMLRKTDPAFLNIQQSILQRDHYTCQFCGFVAYQCLEVVNRDSNYSNNSSSNLCTACPYCAQCFFLESVGQGDFGGGTLIYLPEMTQAELNALCHSLFIAMALGLSYEAEMKNTYRSFKLRSQYVEKELGEGVSNPSLYGRLLVDARIENYNTVVNNFAQKLRLLPTASRFSAQIETWSASAMRQIS